MAYEPSRRSADHRSDTSKRIVFDESEPSRARPLSCTARDLYTSLRSRSEQVPDLSDLAFFTDIRLLEALRESPSDVAGVADAIRAGLRTERQFVKSRASNGSERIRNADEQKMQALRCIPNGLGEPQRHESARTSLIQSWHLAYLDTNDTELVACKARRAGRLTATAQLDERRLSEPARRALRRIYLASEIHVLAEALTEKARALDLPSSHRRILEEQRARIRELSGSRVGTDRLQRHTRRFRTRIDHVLTRHFGLNQSGLRRTRHVLSAVVQKGIRPRSQPNEQPISLRAYGHFFDRCEREARRLISSNDSAERACILLALLIPE